jgi:hypothetical protein
MANIRETVPPIHIGKYKQMTNVRRIHESCGTGLRQKNKKSIREYNFMQCRTCRDG